VDNRDNKPVVTALREVAAAKVRYSHPELLDRVEEQARQIGDEMGFIGDEDDSE
jgi:DNA-directed RNA polymerase subunit K/omega